jgi:hypothetical protein
MSKFTVEYNPKSLRYKRAGLIFLSCLPIIIFGWVTSSEVFNRRLQNVETVSDPCSASNLGPIQKADYHTKGDFFSNWVSAFGIISESEELAVTCLCDKNQSQVFRYDFKDVGSVIILPPKNEQELIKLNIGNKKKYEGFSKSDLNNQQMKICPAEVALK